MERVVTLKSAIEGGDIEVSNWGGGVNENNYVTKKWQSDVSYNLKEIVKPYCKTAVYTLVAFSRCCFL